MKNPKLDVAVQQQQEEIKPANVDIKTQQQLQQIKQIQQLQHI